jgi:hypothetical protein
MPPVHVPRGGHVDDLLTVSEQSVRDVPPDSLTALDRPGPLRESPAVGEHRPTPGDAGGIAAAERASPGRVRVLRRVPCWWADLSALGDFGRATVSTRHAVAPGGETRVSTLQRCVATSCHPRSRLIRPWTSWLAAPTPDCYIGERLSAWTGQDSKADKRRHAGRGRVHRASAIRLVGAPRVDRVDMRTSAIRTDLTGGRPQVTPGYLACGNLSCGRLSRAPARR